MWTRRDKLQQSRRIIEKAGHFFLVCPDWSDMYPKGNAIQLHVNEVVAYDAGILQSKTLSVHTTSPNRVFAAL